MTVTRSISTCVSLLIHTIIFGIYNNFLLFNSILFLLPTKKIKRSLPFFYLLSIHSIEHSYNHPHTITSSFGLKIPNLSIYLTKPSRLSLLKLVYNNICSHNGDQPSFEKTHISRSFINKHLSTLGGTPSRTHPAILSSKKE